MTQVMAYSYDNTLKAAIDKQLEQGKLRSDHVRTTSVDRPKDAPWDFFSVPENRDEAVKRALKDLLGKGVAKKSGVTIEQIA